jgi:hypothetical protein
MLYKLIACLERRALVEERQAWDNRGSNQGRWRLWVRVERFICRIQTALYVPGM